MKLLYIKLFQKSLDISGSNTFRYQLKYSTILFVIGFIPSLKPLADDVMLI